MRQNLQASVFARRVQCKIYLYIFTKKSLLVPYLRRSERIIYACFLLSFNSRLVGWQYGNVAIFIFSSSRPARDCQFFVMQKPYIYLYVLYYLASRARAIDRSVTMRSQSVNCSVIME